MPRNVFTFFRSYYEAIRELDAEHRLELYDAITAYALDGIEPDISGVAKACFLLMKPVLEKSEAKSNAGRKGGLNNQAESKSEANDEQNESESEANEKQAESKLEANWKQIESKPEANVKQTGSDKGVGEGVGVRSKEYTPLTSPHGGSAPSETAPSSSQLVSGTPRRRKPSTLSKTQEERFNRFWAAYPRKVSIAEAEKAWAKISPDDSMTQTILSAVERAKRYDNRFRDPQFIPHPATWLNAQSWRNEYGERSAVAQPYTPRAPSKPNAIDILNNMLSEEGGPHDSR